MSNRQITKPKVAILILNWNGYPDTVECIDSLMRMGYPNFEIFVVDNASSENDVQLLRKRHGDEIRIVENDGNYGYHRGFVSGMRAALKRSADYVLLMQNDLVAKHDLLDQLVEVAESDPAIGMLGPSIFKHEQQELEIAGETIIWSGFKSAPIKPKPEDVWYDCDFLSDVCMLWERNSIYRTNVMELVTPYFLYGDVVWSMCVLKAGLKLAWVPGAVVWHKGSRSARRVLNARRIYMCLKDNLIFRYRFLRDRYYMGLSPRRLIYSLMSFFFYQPLWHLPLIKERGTH